MGKRRRVQASTPGAVVDWVRGADARQICDLLLAVDEVKSAEVLLLLAKYSRDEAEHLLDAVGQEFDQDPMGTFFRGLGGAISGLARRK